VAPSKSRVGGGGRKKRKEGVLSLRNTITLQNYYEGEKRGKAPHLAKTGGKKGS